MVCRVNARGLELKKFEQTKALKSNPMDLVFILSFLVEYHHWLYVDRVNKGTEMQMFKYLLGEPSKSLYAQLNGHQQAQEVL